MQVENTEAIDNAKGDDLKWIRVLKAVNKGHDIRPVVFISLSVTCFFIISC